MFDPKKYWSELEEKKIESHVLNEKKKLMLCKKMTEHRNLFLERANMVLNR